MRNLVLLLLAILLYACGSNSSNSGRQSQNATTYEALSFAGTWVNQKYIDTLLSTRSAMLAQGKEYFLRIPKTMADTGYTFVYHEGGGAFIITKSDNSYFLKNVGADDSTIISFDDKKRLIVKGEPYVKVSDSLLVAERFLFSGTYTLDDKNVTLTENGRIMGIDTAQCYAVETDYYGWGADSMNIIGIGNATGKLPLYCCQFLQDTLFIYNMRCVDSSEGGDCMYFAKTTTLYKLVKKR